VKPSSEAHSGLSYASALGEGGKSPRSHRGKAGGSLEARALARRPSSAVQRASAMAQNPGRRHEAELPAKAEWVQYALAGGMAEARLVLTPTRTSPRGAAVPHGVRRDGEDGDRDRGAARAAGSWGSRRRREGRTWQARS
jgi:hypothetical protein